MVLCKGEMQNNLLFFPRTPIKGAGKWPMCYKKNRIQWSASLSILKKTESWLDELQSFFKRLRQNSRVWQIVYKFRVVQTLTLQNIMILRYPNVFFSKSTCITKEITMSFFGVVVVVVVIVIITFYPFSQNYLLSSVRSFEGERNVELFLF